MNKESKSSGHAVGPGLESGARACSLMLMYNSSFTQTIVLSHVVRAVALLRDNRRRQGDQVFMKNVHAHSAARQGAISRGRVETRVGGEVV